MKPTGARENSVSASRPAIAVREGVMAEFVPPGFRPVDDNPVCTARCDAELEECIRGSAAAAAETCDLNYQACTKDCDHVGE